MKKTARIAGLLYLLLAVTSTVGLSIPGFIVRGDAAATANKLAAHQLLYRLCIVSDLGSQILFVFLVLTLHQLFNGVSKRLAALMVALVFVQVPMMFATMLCVIAPLVLWDGADYWSAFNQHQLDAGNGISGLTCLRYKCGYGTVGSLALAVRVVGISLRIYSADPLHLSRGRLFRRLDHQCHLYAVPRL